MSTNAAPEDLTTGLRRWFGPAALLALCLGLVIVWAGHFRPNYRVTGRVTRDGQPLQWDSDNSMLLVIFAPEDRNKDGNLYRAETDKEAGTYVIPAIPAGKYVVSLQQMDPVPTDDLLHFAFGLGNSPLRCDVKGNQTHDIDLPRELPRVPRPFPPPGQPAREPKEK